MNLNEYLTLKDASKLLNVSAATLRNWDKSGKLIAKRHPVNKYRLYKLSHIQELMNVDLTPQNPITKINSNGLKNTNKKDSLKSVVRLMSKAFRDSQGGSLLNRFEEISKILFCKMFDEKYNDNKGFSFDVNAEDKIIHELIKNTFNKAIQQFPDVFVNGRGFISADVKAIANVARILKKYDLSSMSEDIKGKVYEEIIKNTFEKNENQQYFTPRIIVEFMVRLLNPNNQQKICDPACGSAGFLIETLDYIFQERNLNYSIEEREEYSRNNLLGIEIDSRMVWVSQMNLLMHGGHHNSIKHLKDGGSLSSLTPSRSILPAESFDLILTNPPFGSDYTEKRDLENFEVGKGKKSRRRGILFLEKGLSLLKKGGMMCIILEESILNSPSNKDIRDLILRESIIESVISLPNIAFMPYASVKASILFVRKKSNIKEKNGHIFMANVENTGFRSNGEPIYSSERDDFGRLKLKSDFPKILSAWHEYKNEGEKKLDKYYPNIFVVKSLDDNPENRIDTLFFHPAKEKAYQLISKSKYPIVTLAEVITDYNKLVVPRIEYPDEVVRFIGLTNIFPNHGSYYISEILGEKIKSSVKVFEGNTIVFSKMRPELKKVIYIPENEEPGFVSSECLIFKPSNNINPEYLTMILRNDLIFGQLVFQITGLGRPRISKSALLNVKIPLPTLEEQNGIVEFFNASLKNYENLKAQSNNINQQAEIFITKTYNDIQTNLCP